MNLVGTVKVEIVIGPDGKVKNTNVIGGHPRRFPSTHTVLKGHRGSELPTLKLQGLRLSWIGDEAALPSGDGQARRQPRGVPDYLTTFVGRLGRVRSF